MKASSPGERRGAHRTRRDITAALVPSLLAVIAVAALIVAINVWRGQDSGDDGDSVRTSTTTGTSASPSPSGSGSASASGAPSESGSSGGSTDGSRDIAVVVLNQTTQSGLGTAAADALRADGWSVAALGSFHGVVPSTTVYYPPGAEVQAQAAAESLPTPARIRPRFGNLSTSRLTVVVTDNYPAA
jgi:hypothetical protein